MPLLEAPQNGECTVKNLLQGALTIPNLDRLSPGFNNPSMALQTFDMEMLQFGCADCGPDADLRAFRCVQRSRREKFVPPQLSKAYLRHFFDA